MVRTIVCFSFKGTDITIFPRNMIFYKQTRVSLFLWKSHKFVRNVLFKTYFEKIKQLVKMNRL